VILLKQPYIDMLKLMGFFYWFKTYCHGYLLVLHR